MSDVTVAQGSSPARAPGTHLPPLRDARDKTTGAMTPSTPAAALIHDLGPAERHYAITNFRAGQSTEMPEEEVENFFIRRLDKMKPADIVEFGRLAHDKPELREAATRALLRLGASFFRQRADDNDGWTIGKIKQFDAVVEALDAVASKDSRHTGNVVSSAKPLQGQKFLFDAENSPSLEVRRTALSTLVDGPLTVADLIKTDEPWSNPAVQTAYAREASRASVNDVPTPVGDIADGKADNKDLIALGNWVGGMMRLMPQLPKDTDAVYEGASFYAKGKEGEAVGKVTGGIRVAVGQDKNAKVFPFPVFLFPDSRITRALGVPPGSPIKMPVIGVMTKDAQGKDVIKFVDTKGRVYDNLDKYLAENELPQGDVVHPQYADLTIKHQNGDFIFVSSKTPACNSAWEQVVDYGMIGVGAVATVAGVIASRGYILEVGEPIAAATVTGLRSAAVWGGRAAASWMLYKRGRAIYDGALHHENMNPITNKEMRANYIGVVTSLLGLRGGAAASTGGSVSRIVVEGVQVTANVYGVAVQALDIAENWGQMNNKQRAFALFALSFHLTGTGISIRNSYLMAQAIVLNARYAALLSKYKGLPDSSQPEEQQVVGEQLKQIQAALSSGKPIDFKDVAEKVKKANAALDGLAAKPPPVMIAVGLVLPPGVAPPLPAVVAPPPPAAVSPRTHGGPPAPPHGAHPPAGGTPSRHVPGHSATSERAGMGRLSPAQARALAPGAAAPPPPPPPPASPAGPSRGHDEDTALTVLPEQIQIIGPAGGSSAPLSGAPTIVRPGPVAPLSGERTMVAALPPSAATPSTGRSEAPTAVAMPRPTGLAAPLSGVPTAIGPTPTAPLPVTPPRGVGLPPSAVTPRLGQQQEAPTTVGTRAPYIPPAAAQSGPRPPAAAPAPSAATLPPPQPGVPTAVLDAATLRNPGAPLTGAPTAVGPTPVAPPAPSEVVVPSTPVQPPSTPTGQVRAAQLADVMGGNAVLVAPSTSVRPPSTPTGQVRAAQLADVMRGSPVARPTASAAVPASAEPGPLPGVRPTAAPVDHPGPATAAPALPQRASTAAPTPSVAASPKPNTQPKVVIGKPDKGAKATAPEMTRLTNVSGPLPEGGTYTTPPNETWIFKNTSTTNPAEVTIFRGGLPRDRVIPPGGTVELGPNSKITILTGGQIARVS